MGLESKQSAPVGFKALVGPASYSGEWVSQLGPQEGPDGYVDARKSPEAVARNVVATKERDLFSLLFGWALPGKK